MAKKAGLKAVLKKQELVEKEVEQTEDLRYKIILSPPLGKRPSMTVQRGRILSILTLCMSIGLLCFQYLANYLFPIDDITTISSIISVFFWLFPTIWLLDDAGVLYYINTIKERELEDVESVGGWFGSYLEGFFGISAIITYVQFVINSPILLSYENLGTDSTIILAFVFGFIVLAGLAFGFLVIAVYELSLPFTVGKLYDRLKLRHVDTIQKTIKFENGSELTADFASQAYSKEVNVEVIAETPKLEENKD